MLHGSPQQRSCQVGLSLTLLGCERQAMSTGISFLAIGANNLPVPFSNEEMSIAIVSGLN